MDANNGSAAGGGVTGGRVRRAVDELVNRRGVHDELVQLDDRGGVVGGQLHAGPPG
ncbi:hypothetical protein [Cellulomonas cellasea]|uniref:Uncharacterized protein n=1 Tax=Cellulomonas cellasea TaxID=43670 RepID=A0A7W4YDU3_9CELL|nr:hypothetical protein [Cellulomonas cellasea]MBB2925509.1 hypothetical protein [Cellulomonas cellasea]